MKIGIICGSQRVKSQTAKVGRFVQHSLNDKGIDTFLLDLGEHPLPNFDDTFWYEKQGSLQTAWQSVAEELQSCEGFIVLTPDWHGMVPSCLKNFFLYTGTAEMANKPGLIIAISSGVGGYLPVAELRISSYKNNRICWIPDHIIVRNVKNCMNDFAEPDGDDDSYIRARLSHSLSILIAYSHALGAVRESEITAYDTYQYGM